MICLNNRILVKFDADHNRVFNVGDVELIRPEAWANNEADDGTTKFAENTNYLETKPQVCVVLAANPRYPYQEGDRLFVHYMAWETAQLGDIVTNEGMIIADYVFFTIVEDDIRMSDGNYLGEQVVTPEEVTPSGIIINIGGKKEALRVKITHVPEDSDVEIGDTIISIDQYNYPLKYDGKTYIRLTDREIVATVIWQDQQEQLRPRL